MAIKNPFEKHYGETKTVLTKKDLDEALSSQYGRICITGDLLKDIEKDFEKKTGKAVFGAIGVLGFGILQFIPVVGGVFSLMTVISGGAFLSSKHAGKYSVRAELSSSPNELWILHDTEVKKIRDKYNGVTVATAKNLSEFDDMMIKDVSTIHISKELIDDLLKQINNTKKPDKHLSIKDLEKYKGYRMIDEDPNYRFVKIR